MPSFFLGEIYMLKLIPIFLFLVSGCITEPTIATATDSRAKKQDLPRVNTSAQSLISVITLKNTESKQYQNLTFDLLAIEDSRCPIGEQCIWAGQITVTLKVSNQATETKKVKLIRKRESNIANAFGYNIRLLDVSPPPKKDKVIQLSEQTVTLEVVKS